MCCCSSSLTAFCFSAAAMYSVGLFVFFAFGATAACLFCEPVLKFSTSSCKFVGSFREHVSFACFGCLRMHRASSTLTKTVLPFRVLVLNFELSATQFWIINHCFIPSTTLVGFSQRVLSNVVTFGSFAKSKLGVETTRDDRSMFFKSQRMCASFRCERPNTLCGENRHQSTLSFLVGAFADTFCFYGLSLPSWC